MALIIVFNSCQNSKKTKYKESINTVEVELIKIVYSGEYSKIKNEVVEIYFEVDGVKEEKILIKKGTFIESTNDSIYRGFEDTLLLKSGRLKVSFDKDFIPGYITFHTLNENLQDYEFFVYPNTSKKLDKISSKKYIYIK